MDRIEQRKGTRMLLMQWGCSEEYVARMERKRKALKIWADDALDTLRAQNLSGMPGGGRGSDLADVVANAMRRAEIYQDRLAEIDREIQDHLRMCSVIDRAVHALSPVAQRVIENRYVCGMSWRLIALRMNYDERQVRRIDAQAVDLIDKSLADAETRPDMSANDRQKSGIL